MSLHDLIDADAIIPSLRVTTKKQALQEISERASVIAGLPAREIFDALLQRERLGSTGVGGGIAIPHGKLPRVTRMLGVFARLERPIDYEALDGEPVDLVFLLLAPESAGADHLKALSRVARALRDPSLTARLRATKDASGLYLLLTQNPAHHAA
ncbi:MAG: PTS IIA-like nitrogen regulatory protein PtsN [Beijerinckiaceae bacterium]